MENDRRCVVAQKTVKCCYYVTRNSSVTSYFDAEVLLSVVAQKNPHRISCDAKTWLVALSQLVDSLKPEA